MKQWTQAPSPALSGVQCACHVSFVRRAKEMVVESDEVGPVHLKKWFHSAKNSKKNEKMHEYGLCLMAVLTCFVMFCTGDVLWPAIGLKICRPLPAW